MRKTEGRAERRVGKRCRGASGFAVMAVVLAAMPATGCGERGVHARAKGDAAVRVVELKVSGMTCRSCEAAITAAVGKIEGVKACSASHTKKGVRVEVSDGEAEAEVRRVIRSLGFGVEVVGGGKQ